VTEAEDALLALSKDLVREIALGMALELAQPAPAEPQQVAQVNPWPAKTGAAAVHPHLGGHLVTPYPGDTISGHAHAHVPRPVEPALPDPREEKLKTQGEELKGYKDWEAQVRQYRQAADELDKHVQAIRRSGKRLPPYKRPKSSSGDT
jgi:hypothetical protein